MKNYLSNARLPGVCKYPVAIALLSVAFHAPNAFSQDVPKGFHQTPDGTIVANDPATAVVPPGYYMRRNGTLIKLAGRNVLVDPKVAKTVKTSANAIGAEGDDAPQGFHRLPDGRLKADDPETAEAPPGYYMRRNGILIKLDDVGVDPDAPAPKASLKPGEVPPGFHKLPDGRIMADDPENAVAPPGYHIMSGGQLMSNTGMGGGGGHHHGKGMWMVDYRFTRMYMKDMLDTTTKVTASQAVDENGSYNYMMAPVDMTMDMHMLMIMYGLTDKVMPMLMLHYMSNSMEMLSFDGTRSTMKSSGVADTLFTAMIQGPHKLNFNVGLSIPTGSIDVSGPMTHMQGVTNHQKYGYGMQLGSGSYELKHGISYEDSAGKLGWGLSYEYTARLNENKNDYRLGNILLADSWLQYGVMPSLLAKGKLQLRALGQIQGADPELVEDNNASGNFRAMSPALDASNSGGNRVDASLTLKYTVPNTMISITGDFSMPVYQNLWGPQMATSWIASINFGWMKH